MATTLTDGTGITPNHNPQLTPDGGGSNAKPSHTGSGGGLDHVLKPKSGGKSGGKSVKNGKSGKWSADAAVKKLSLKSTGPKPID